MGILEDHIEWLIQDQFPYVKAQEGWWIQRDGKKVWLRDMEGSHLQNCVGTINRDLKRDVPDEIKQLMRKKKEELRKENARRVE
ncbi:hypothetical protein [Lacrimispora sp.]|uniref:hypothetical protein n=1 Tax=Lacrimispora sp. TaxID=2719234 RepID=UPI00289D7413|nr:hypothetical protein [Lacrimispora sp.]